MEKFNPKTKKNQFGSISIFPELCKGCGICLVKCPKGALSFSKENGVYNTPIPEVDSEKCGLCGICEIFCPDCAIKIVKKNG